MLGQHLQGDAGQQRLKLFGQAVDELRRGIPVNVILFPMEGDPMAASSYWKLAIGTGRRVQSAEIRSSVALGVPAACGRLDPLESKLRQQSASSLAPQPFLKR